MAVRSASPTKFQGQPWSNWTDFLGRTTPQEEIQDVACPVKRPVDYPVKLPRKHMDLLGYCPEVEPFNIVVCETCQAVVKPQVLKTHIARRHSAANNALPLSSAPATPIIVMKKTPAAEPFKSLIKNGKSKVRLKKSAIAIAKADSTTVPVNNDINNNMATSTNPEPTDITVDATVVSSTTSTAEPVTGVTTNLIPNGVSHNNLVGINSTAVILTPPTSDIVEDIDNPVSSSSSFINVLPVVSKMEVDEKITDNFLQNGEFTIPSPIVSSTPPSPVIPVSIKLPVPALVSLAVASPPNNIPPVITVATTSAKPQSLLKPTVAKPRRKVRSERKSVSAKEKVFNADRHCGVVINDAKPCTRSLTCSLHSMTLKRAVEGRSKSFDQLLAEHQATKETVIRPKRKSDSTLVHNTPSTVAVLNIQVDGVEAPFRYECSGGGCSPVEMEIRSPISLLSPYSVGSQLSTVYGSSSSEKLTATPSDVDSPLAQSINLTVNGTQFIPRQNPGRVFHSSFNKIVELPEVPVATISTAVGYTVSRSHPKPLALGLFNCHKIGGLIYQNRKFPMARHYVSDLEHLF